MPSGLIIRRGNYTYEGTFRDDEPHGKGIFCYSNGDIYKGSCKFGYPDGFGIYTYRKGCKYTGFFRAGKLCGIGTFEDNKNIYKGPWYNGAKHGIFYCTKKKTFRTYKQKWKKGTMVESENHQYIQPAALATVKVNPLKLRRRYQIPFKGRQKSCSTCTERPADAISTACGHVIVCYKCWEACETCPICRAPKSEIIRLYIS